MKIGAVVAKAAEGESGALGAVKERTVGLGAVRIEFARDLVQSCGRCWCGLFIREICVKNKMDVF